MGLQLFHVLKRIYHHPFNSNDKIGGVLRFFKWQINCRLNPHPIIYSYTENSKFIIWKGLTGATGNLYSRLMEYDEMGFVLHFLRPHDLFVDIGSNVGAYTILASAEIGANTIAVEPVPSTFKNLLDNISINWMKDRVKALNVGLGSKKGNLKFTNSFDTMNHVATENDEETIEVEIRTLDSILEKEKSPSLLKIDVEGFETEVLSGANKTLQNEKLKAIIIELNGSGSRYGYDENKIHENLLSNGFKPYSYNPKLRELKMLESFGNQNTIYIRNRNYVLNRLSSAKKTKIGNTRQYI